jgi:quercetin dioxygenase-like cupin family protein
MKRHGLVVAAALLVLAWSVAPQVHAKNSPLSSVTVMALAQGQVKALPPGKIFINILEFRQLPGGDYGPHYHIPGVVYTLHGTSTIAFAGAASRSVGPGEAAFIPGLVVHTHENLDGRAGAISIAGGLIVAVILLCAATWIRGGRRRVVIAVLSLSLVAGGALPLIGATSNDFYFIAVRSVSQRPQPMPRPDGRVAYSSPDADPVPAGPYIEALSAITVPVGANYDAPYAAGPQMIIVVDGSATVDVGGESTQLAGGGVAFAQTGQTLAIVNRGSGVLKVLDFTVTSTTAVRQ